MRSAEVGELKDDVVEGLELFEGEAIRRRFRCYEWTRTLQRHLGLLGYANITVHDGKVIYEADFLRERLTPKDPELLQEIWVQDWLSRIAKRVLLHSWLKVGDVLVDYHAYIPLLRGSGVENVLFVHNQDEVVGKARYIKRGGEINVGGISLVYSPPLYLTRLRI